MPPQSKAELKLWMEQDLRGYIANGSFPSQSGCWKWWHRFQYPLIYWQRLLRKTEYAANVHTSLAWMPWVLFLRWRFMRRSLELNLEIPLNVFGPGLTISHYGTIVVNSKARVGQNCLIHPGTCIGELKDRNPVIGDDVYIGNGAIIIGDVQVGDGAKIGPHALVRKHVASGSTVVAEESRDLINNSRVDLCVDFRQEQ